MSLDDHLLPSETIQLRSRTPVSVGKDRYRLYLTQKRLILHNQRGLLKRDTIMAWKLGEVSHTKFSERGLIFRKGFLKIESHGSAHTIVGNPADLRAIHLQVTAGASR